MLKPVLGSQIQLGHPLANNLVGCWLFNEGGGSTAFDSSRNGNHGTHVSPAVYTGGISGYCADYVAQNNAAVTTLKNEILVEANYTIAIRLYCTTLEGTASAKMFMGKSDTNNYFAILNTDDVRIQNDDNNNEDWTVGFSTPAWHTLIVTNDGTNWTLYVDDVSYGVQAYDAPLLVSMIGNGYNVNNYNFDSKIDYVMIWDRFVSSGEAASLYLNPFCMFEYSTIDLWTAATSIGVPTGNAGIMTTNAGFWGVTLG